MKKTKIISHQNQFWVPRIKIKAENNVLIQKGNEKKDTEKKQRNGIVNKHG